MENKYFALRAVAVLSAIAGWSMLVLGVIATTLLVAGSRVMALDELAARVPMATFWSRLELPTLNPVVAGGLIGMASIIGFLVLSAGGDLILLLLELEQRASDIENYLQPRV